MTCVEQCRRLFSFAPSRLGAIRLTLASLRALPRLGAIFLLPCFGAQPPIPIGYYGPSDAAHPVGGALWQGAQLAVEEANAAGGYENRPFTFVTGWDENPWTGGASVVVRMAYDDQARAVIGSINAGATHLAEQVVAKALLPLVDPASTDRTVNAAFVPWCFSVMPDDRALMRAIAGALPDAPFALLTATDHDSRMMTAEFFKLLGKRRPERHVQSDNPAARAGEIATLKISAAVILAGAADSAAAVNQLRRVRPELLILGGPAFGSRLFRERAGIAAEGALFPWPCADSAAASAFTRRFLDRYGAAPDCAARHAYDAVNLVIEAIRTAGLEREAIRDALLRRSPYEGVSGPIVWDELRRNSRPALLATLRGGGVVLLERERQPIAAPANRATPPGTAAPRR